MLKICGSWSPVRRLVAGAFWTVMSGSPINRFASGLPNGEAAAFLVPRGSVGRTSTTGSLDRRLAYELPERSRMRTRLLLDLLRVGNAQSVVRVDELLYTSVDSSRVPLATNARYGAPLGYLPPMAVRLGLEVSY